MEILAFDKETARHKDANGFLHVDTSNITKEQVVSYKGREIPGYQALGLNAGTDYNVYRPADEIRKAAATFNNLPINSVHTPITAENYSDKADKVIGSTGTDARWDPPYLTNSLVINSKEYIEKIESGEQQELSCSYRYTPVMRSGSFEGTPYTIVMTDIKGNHVAAVERGRAGSDVFVADSANTNQSQMKKKTKAEKLVLAMDGKIDADKIAGILFALDEEEKKESEAAEEKKARAEKEVTDKKARDEAETEEEKGELEKKEKEAKDKKVKDEAEKDEKEKEQAKEHAEDSARSYMRKIHEAGRVVKPIVGELENLFDFANDSAVYTHALKSRGVSIEGVHPSALKALAEAEVKVIEASRSRAGFASDSMPEPDKAKIKQMFPNLNRIKHI